MQSCEFARGNYMHLTAILKINTLQVTLYAIHFPTTPALQLQIKALSNTSRHTYQHILLSWTQLHMKLPLCLFIYSFTP